MGFIVELCVGEGVGNDDEDGDGNDDGFIDGTIDGYDVGINVDSKVGMIDGFEVG